jgi:hypothetical protein
VQGYVFFAAFGIRVHRAERIVLVDTGQALELRMLMASGKPSERIVLGARG